MPPCWLQAWPLQWGSWRLRQVRMCSCFLAVCGLSVPLHAPLWAHWTHPGLLGTVAQWSRIVDLHVHLIEKSLSTIRDFGCSLTLLPGTNSVFNKYCHQILTHILSNSLPHGQAITHCLYNLVTVSMFCYSVMWKLVSRVCLLQGYYGTNISFSLGSISVILLM